MFSFLGQEFHNQFVGLLVCINFTPLLLNTTSYIHDTEMFMHRVVISLRSRMQPCRPELCGLWLHTTRSPGCAACMKSHGSVLESKAEANM